MYNVILSLYLNASGWSVRPKHVACSDKTNKICCG